MALPGLVFCSSLSIAFFGLVVIALFEGREIKRQEHPLAGLPHVFIPPPVVRALRRILIVESAGFVLASAAAVFEALSQ